MRIVIRNSTCWCCVWAVGGYFVLPPLFILPFLSSHHPDRRRGPAAAPPGQHLESAQAVLDDPLMQGPRRLGQSLMTGSTGSRSALSDRPNRGSVGPDTHPLHSSPRHRTETMLRYSTFQCTKYEKQDARAAEAQGFRVCSSPEERTMKDRPVGSEPGTCAARHTNRRCDCQTADLVNKSCHGVGGKFHSLTGHPAHVPEASSALPESSLPGLDRSAPLGPSQAGPAGLSCLLVIRGPALQRRCSMLGPWGPGWGPSEVGSAITPGSLLNSVADQPRDLPDLCSSARLALNLHCPSAGTEDLERYECACAGQQQTISDKMSVSEHEPPPTRSLPATQQRTSNHDSQFRNPLPHTAIGTGKLGIPSAHP